MVQEGPVEGSWEPENHRRANLHGSGRSNGKFLRIWYLDVELNDEL
jgi:hypothetical protein